MTWSVELKESVIDDLWWFGKRDGRQLLREALRRLEDDPRAETRPMKTLRPNPVAGRELRSFGKYRVLFHVDEAARLVTIALVDEQRGEALFVQGEEFTGPRPMKVIPLSEAKARLSQYGRLCHDEPVIVTVNGVPSFQLVPPDEDDDLIDRLLEHHPSFRRALEARLRERSLSAREALKRL